MNAVTITKSCPRDIRDFEDGRQVDQVLLVRDAETGKTRAGSDFMRLCLTDRTGVVTGMVWHDVDAACELAQPGSALQVTGEFAHHPRFGAQIAVTRVSLPDFVDWERLVVGPSEGEDALHAGLDNLIASIDCTHLSRLVEHLVGADAASGSVFRRAFAARYNHHAYRSGLLEHSLAVARAVDAACEIFGEVDRDLAVCGALLHDIGKLGAYSGDDHAVDLNDAGRLVGEIPMGYYLVRRQIEELPGFPASLAQALLHIILSHHGRLEYGSPVVPSTREALLVHTMDNLSGDLGSFDRLKRETDPAQTWSRFDRALGRSVFLPS